MKFRTFVPENNLNIYDIMKRLVFLSLLTCVLCAICTHTLQAKEASSEQKLDSIELKLRETYTKREVMIPMRDGIKLYTAIYEPKREASEGTCSADTLISDVEPQ